MTTTDSSITLTCFFDAVLAEIESGKVQQGINQLAGMLDARCMQPGALADAAAELRQHPLHQVLLEDPIYLHAAKHPGECEGLATAVATAADTVSISAIGRRLNSIVADLPIVQALLQRHHRSQHATIRGWQDGLRVCNVGHGLPEALSGRDVGNVTCLAALPQSFMFAADRQFELICAPSLTDSIPTGSLSALFERVKPLLALNGRIVFSALLPHHLGTGWRLACLHWPANTHCEEALRQQAAAAGFAANIFREESDCTVWAELRIATQLSTARGKSHAK
jgi:hypothetical protein